jgi:hypothetical protein
MLDMKDRVVNYSIITDELASNMTLIYDALSAMYLYKRFTLHVFYPRVISARRGHKTSNETILRSLQA